MGRSSCIPNPEGEDMVLIRAWMMRACEGDGCAAALLNFFVFNHDNKLANKRQAVRYNDVAEAHGDTRSQQENLYQWHTAKELEEGILKLYSARSIPKSLDRLERLGFISISQNPNKRYKFDRTKYFLVHPEVIKAWLKNDEKAQENLESLAGDTDGKNAIRSNENAERSSNLVSQSCIPARAITMTSSMTSSNDQEEKDTDEFFVNSSSTPNQENSFPVQTTPKIEETPNPQSPLSPLPPENKPKREVVDTMGDRFRDAGKKSQQVKDWQQNDSFLRYIHKGLAKKSDYHKDQPYTSAKHYIGKASLTSPDMVLRYEELCDHYKAFLEAQAADRLATQQRQAPTDTPQQSAPQIDPIARKRMIEEARRKVAQQAA